jgi:hypothetical protein
MKRKRKKRKIYDLGMLRNHAARRQNNRCFHCGAEMCGVENHPLQLTADHYPIPVYAGGKTEPGNIVAACRRCNNSRNSEETNRGKDPVNVVIGIDRHYSPFASLKDII